MVYVKMVNSFICMIINISDSVNMCKKTKKFLFQTSREMFIYIHINKE